MRYFLNYQYLPKNSVRPRDDGETIQIDIQADGHAILPNVGDYVEIEGGTTGGSSFDGVVKSRLFRYIAGDACAINIVVEETDVDWGALVKE